jgi:hypothetical protein
VAAVAGFVGAAIGLGFIISALVGLARGTPTIAPRVAVIGFVAFAVVRVALLVLAALALLRRHRRARLVGVVWAALALVDSVVAVTVLGAPLLAAIAGALAPVVTIAVLAAWRPSVGMP